MKRIVLLISCTYLLLAGTPLKGQNINIEDTVSNIRVEDLSFLFDETVTKVGSDFFQKFHSKWDNPSNVQGVSIYIGEKPIPGMGTQIWIKVGDRIVYRAVLRPNPEQLRQEVKRALLMVRNYFINYELIQKQLDSQDYSGNGIY